MKVSHIVALLLLVIHTYGWATSPDTKYDWQDHVDGEDLSISLRNEPGDIFVVFFFKNIKDNKDLGKANDALRNKIKNDLSAHDEVVYTEVNLSDDNPKKDSYKQLAENEMGIDTKLLDQGPVVAVLNRGEGSWIHGQGKPVTDSKSWKDSQDSFEEILDSIEIFIAEAKDRITGGSGKVPGSKLANRGGMVSVGGQNYPY